MKLKSVGSSRYEANQEEEYFSNREESDQDEGDSNEEAIDVDKNSLFFFKSVKHLIRFLFRLTFIKEKITKKKKMKSPKK